MPWIILVASAIFEAVWATALGASDGFTRVGPVIVFLVALAISMAGLAWAVQTIPIGTAYAGWTGIGAALTVTYAIIAGGETASPLKIMFLTGIILAVVGLKLIPNEPRVTAKNSQTDN